ncbi:MAG: nucleoside deaminase, partial [Hydrotalea sp.]|nr:nucleoside deaminase [Hydrotalea sp.]
MIDYIASMKQLLAMARAASQEKEEVPVAAMVLAENGVVLAASCNMVEETKNALAHAEMVAMATAMKKTGDKFLANCTLIVTLEPCAMCAAAISAARIKTLVFGGYDEKSGGVLSGAKIFANPNCHHAPDIIDGILRTDCESLMKDFFLGKRG